MPVGTNATVKAIFSEDLVKLDTQIILANTYHLFLRPGMEVIKRAGGLHQFMKWDRPILTDSGGYQVFSLAKFRKISDEGVQFQSHIDGTPYFFRPEDIVAIEGALGVDIIMPLDECAPYPCERKEAESACRRTTFWAKRSREAFLNNKEQADRQLLFVSADSPDPRPLLPADQRPDALPGRHLSGRPEDRRVHARHSGRSGDRGVQLGDAGAHAGQVNDGRQEDLRDHSRAGAPRVRQGPARAGGGDPRSPAERISG